MARRWQLPVLVVAAGLSFWLLLAGPDRILGIDLGGFGVALAAWAAWYAIHLLSTAPRGEWDERVAPGEGRAWIGLVFTVLVAGYLLARHQFIARAGDYRELGHIGTNVVLLLVVWAVIAQVMRWRWKERVQEDERDRQIERHAADWGHGALVFCVIGLAAMLALSPQSRLAWATPIVTAHLLVFALLWGSIVEHAASAIAYWRDRRA
ncbi:MAG: hypothetical protein KA911_03260 [Xanthomonadales bacterium]|nr:hypothetical protein [Xanthomonadales bacterium]MBP7417599.1 hypothetical protein [Xanthomonadales bacterium]